MSSKSTLLAGLFGNALEWYDFILYANFAPIIALLFFPKEKPFIALLLTFIVFATGFLVRPFGALIFGYIGDHFGRRKALIISICTMTIPTILMAFIPVYQHVGILAPILLTVLRLLQGIAVSGELNSATTYVVEHAQPHRRGLAGCLIIGTAFFAILIGALVSTGMNLALTPTALHDWGWRVAFLFGGVLGIIGLMIRLHCKESPKFLTEQPHEIQAPLKQVFLFHRKNLLITFLLTAIMGVGNYIFLAYVISFLVKLQGMPLREANIINLISMVVLVILFPVMGMLSDKFGRKPVFRAGLIGSIIFSIPIFWLLSQKQFAYALAGDLLLCLVIVPIAALIPTLIAELFPTQVRNSGTAVGYNVSLAIFGGTAPLVALSLVHVSGSTLAPAFYLMACAVLALITLYFVKESYDKPLA